MEYRFKIFLFSFTSAFCCISDMGPALVIQGRVNVTLTKGFQEDLRIDSLTFVLPLGKILQLRCWFSIRSHSSFPSKKKVEHVFKKESSMLTAATKAFK